RDGKVEGAAWERAHEALASFYKPDEAAAFDVWRGRRSGTIVVYFESRGGKDPIWLALDADGRELYDVARLPPGVLGAMLHASK
ncbi:MAG TPA: hypothetical protein VHB21_26260, partial [Minicystis sp.]|nr:hypothetical protein [Minicystis sp.]